MDECKHNWIFQETYKKDTIESNFDCKPIAHFERVDRYYCSNCCEVKEIKKEEGVRVPYRRSEPISKYAPVWY